MTDIYPTSVSVRRRAAHGTDPEDVVKPPKGVIAQHGQRSDADVGALLPRLRIATAGLHRQVEDKADLPHSVRTWADYCALLAALHGLHAGIESCFKAAGFRRSWADLGVDLADHCRSHLLVEDLARLGAPVPKGPMWAPSVSTFGQALGCLYVVEGSAFGGRVLAPLFRAGLGDAPVSFFQSDGLGHPSPWPKVVAALQRFEAEGGAVAHVLLGARQAYFGFGHRLDTRSTQRRSGR